MASVGRLTFLYPHLARAARAGCPREVHRAQAVAGWARQKSSFAPRHGTAVDPTLPKKLDDLPPPQKQEAQQQANSVMEESVADTGELSFERGEPASGEEAQQSEPPGEAEPAEMMASSLETPATSEEISSAGEDANSSDPEEEQLRMAREEARPSGPLEAVLQMPAPEKVARQHPSLSPSPYVHHFDSYSFVKLLQEDGYTAAQAITAMKGIRGILAQNLDVAQESLVSKSDVENETYLFRAACSELSTEIRNNRRLQDEHSRQQRMHLQHEVDNLTQSLNQELLTLNDNVRGMFNDRKMAVREEQKSVESAVQQINYKISIMLSSDSKSEIEGVRWILIRRSVLGILFMAVMTLGTLRYATYVSHERQKDTERLKREAEEERRNGANRDDGSDAALVLANG